MDGLMKTAVAILSFLAFTVITIPTAPLDDDIFCGNAIDLPDSDPRVQRWGDGFQQVQISVSLSTTYDSVWVSWITGEFQIRDHIEPLDPLKVASIVHFGRLQHPLAWKKGSWHGLKTKSNEGALCGEEAQGAVHGCFVIGWGF